MLKHEFQKILHHGYKYGHLHNPRHPELLELFDADLTKLNQGHPLAEALVLSVQETDHVLHEIAQQVNGRPLDIDGVPGPATLALTDVPRCGCPDFGPGSGPFLFDDGTVATPAGQILHGEQLNMMMGGNGNWKGCHEIGPDFHRAITRANNGIPTHLKRMYEGVTLVEGAFRLAHDAYAALGLDWIVEWHGQYTNRKHQTTSDFGNYAGGWIGLAIVANGLTCASNPIWARYQNSYRQSTTDLQLVTFNWADLIAHEEGHKVGMGHSARGPSVMGPSGGGGRLIATRGWKGDPVEPQLISRFGGKPIPASEFPGWSFGKWA